MDIEGRLSIAAASHGCDNENWLCMHKTDAIAIYCNDMNSFRI